MFSGIVEGTGHIRAIEDVPGLKRFVVRAPEIAGELKIGASVSVDGCCLTVTRIEDGNLVFDLMEITLERTRFGKVGVGDRVNLERSLKIGDEIGGHFVQGHVDGVGEVTSVADASESRRVEIRIPASLTKYAARTGSISVNGVSLTVAEVRDDVITIGIIPHTWKLTNFAEFKPGTRVNIEADMIAKYLERLLTQNDDGNMTAQETHAR